MLVEPYLFFDGKCEEAIEFYKRTVGAEVIALLRWKDSPDPQMANPSAADKVMHARLRIGDRSVMASDGECKGKPEFKGFALSVTAADAAEAARLFAALGEGGQVHMPLSKTFFSPSFGMLADRFGVSWMVYVEA
jgi:PhnB protein